MYSLRSVFHGQLKLQCAQAEEMAGDLPHRPEVPVKPVSAVAFKVLLYKAGETFQCRYIDLIADAKRIVEFPGLPAADQHQSQNFHALRVIAKQSLEIRKSPVPGGGIEKLFKQRGGLGEERVKCGGAPEAADLDAAFPGQPDCVAQ